MMAHFTVASPHPMHITDKAFFSAHPKRRFLARSYVAGDAPILPPIVLFAEDGTGKWGEINLVIVKRIVGGRIRTLFAVPSWPLLQSDRAIREFLWSRNIDPATLKQTQ